MYWSEVFSRPWNLLLLSSAFTIDDGWLPPRRGPVSGIYRDTQAFGYHQIYASVSGFQLLIGKLRSDSGQEVPGRSSSLWGTSDFNRETAVSGGVPRGDGSSGQGGSHAW